MPTHLPEPEPDNPNRLPSALTFYLPREHRREVLNALRPLSTDRTRALLLALGLTEHTEPTEPTRR